MTVRPMSQWVVRFATILAVLALSLPTMRANVWVKCSCDTSSSTSQSCLDVTGLQPDSSGGCTASGSQLLVLCRKEASVKTCWDDPQATRKASCSATDQDDCENIAAAVATVFIVIGVCCCACCVLIIYLCNRKKKNANIAASVRPPTGAYQPGPAANVGQQQPVYMQQQQHPGPVGMQQPIPQQQNPHQQQLQMYPQPVVAQGVVYQTGAPMQQQHQQHQQQQQAPPSYAPTAPTAV